MSAGEILISLLVIVIIVIIGVVIYFNFNNLFPGLKNILNPPPPETTTPSPPPETTQPKPPETTQPPKPLETTQPPKPPETTKPKPPSETTRPKPPPDTIKPKPDGRCTYKPTGVDPPKIPIPNSVILDINDKSKSNMLLQDNGSGRIVTSNGIITVSMEPKDVDTVTQGSDRQRNEVSIKNSKMILKTGKKGTWGCEFKLNQNVTWDIKQGHYHIIQIKSLDQSQPVFTVSLNGTNICARTGEDVGDKRYDVIQPICSTVDTWIPFTVQIDDKENGAIMYNINGKIGAFKMPKPLELYMKVGQYRATPNNINYTTSSSYKNICFTLES